jgi:hypothetical protein
MAEREATAKPAENHSAAWRDWLRTATTANTSAKQIAMMKFTTRKKTAPFTIAQESAANPAEASVQVS